MLKTKPIKEMLSLKVYTDEGSYFGDIEEAILSQNKVYGWKVKATRTSFLDKILGGAKGVIVPHQFVRSVGDVMIISKDAIPSYETKEE